MRPRSAGQWRALAGWEQVTQFWKIFKTGRVRYQLGGWLPTTEAEPSAVEKCGTCHGPAMDLRCYRVLLHGSCPAQLSHFARFPFLSDFKLTHWLVTGQTCDSLVNRYACLLSNIIGLSNIMSTILERLHVSSEVGRAFVRCSLMHAMAVALQNPKQAQAPGTALRRLVPSQWLQRPPTSRPNCLLDTQTPPKSWTTLAVKLAELGVTDMSLANCPSCCDSAGEDIPACYVIG